MPLNEEELLKRDASRNIGEELLQAIRDVKAGNVGAKYEVEPYESSVIHIKTGWGEARTLTKTTTNI